MPVAFQVSDLIEDVRTRLDLPTYSASTNPTSTQILNMCTESALRLSAVVRSAFGADYFETSTDLTTQSGLEYVSLPDNCSAVNRLVWVRGTDDFVEIERAPQHETHAWSGGWSSRRPKYRLRTGVIWFFPTPDAAYTVKCTYDTGIVVTATTDYINGEPGWREWMTLDVCRKMRMADEKDGSDLLLAQQQVEAMIKSLAPRDKAGITQVRDVDDDRIRIRPWELIP